MLRLHAALFPLLPLGVTLICTSPAPGQPTGDPLVAPGPHWSAPDRGEKVAALIPGRSVPRYTPDTLFADWTRRQVESWERDHPPLPPDQAYAAYAAAAPTDAELAADFPVHISPFGRVRSGDPGPEKAAAVMISYCPFCGSQSLSFEFDPDNPFGHATAACCRTELYAREKDWPADYALKPTETVRFPHLDDTSLEVPCTLYQDSQGVVWELFIRTLFDHQRWVNQGCELVKELGLRFRDTADPLCAHKIAVVLDRVADTYFGLPLSDGNELCRGKDGGPLTRAEWEAVPRPAIFEVSYLGPWSRRLPLGSKGWLNMFHEHLWVEPFARVRHHPAFQDVSRRLYGDPDALDRKIRTKLLREVSLMFQSVFSQKLLHNYQEAVYIDLWLLGVLLQDKVLLDFAGPCQELSMYNHSYQDGMNGEGAPNYMDMPGGYYYPVLKDPQGWLQYQPDFLEQNPFYQAASTEMHRTATVRGLELEFGDQHEECFAPGLLTDPARLAQNEMIGSRNWAGYGVGLLRVGGPGHRQEVGLSYTRATLHNARDALSLECWVDGVPVLRKGGYSAWWSNAHLQWDRPEYEVLRRMGYPHEMREGGWSFDSWSWIWSHSPLCQNTVTVDEQGTGAGWGDNRGYGECLTFKGGEEAGSPGSGFQVLDVRDHYSWARVGQDITDFRRTLIGVEGPDGRPYVLDLLTLTGGRRHALYSNAWGERAEDQLPAATGRADDLGRVLFGDEPPDDKPETRNFAQVKAVEHLAIPGPTYSVTWKTDYAAYAPRDPGGRPLPRPLPEDVGQVRLRLLGVDAQDGRTRLLRGKGPWIGWLRQPLPNSRRADGYVAFDDARDFLIECRRAGQGEAALDSLFTHVLEGFREGEASALRSVTPLPATSTAGPQRRIVALRLDMTAGHTDTLLYQSEPGAVLLPDGTTTDARYALLRTDAQDQVTAADACRATYLRRGEFSVALPGDFTGAIVDVIGDLTGTRRESALLIRPDKPWPAGANLRGKQLLVRVDSSLRSACNEGYRVDSVSPQADGTVRVDLQDAAPFVTSWHEVTVLPADRPNVIRTWRPMVDHGNTPWYAGMRLWFPERGRTYTIKGVNEVGGGYGGDTVELVENVNLAEEGIRVGDWYVIHALQPGQQVVVANDFSFRREPAGDWQQYGIRATGDVALAHPALQAACSSRGSDGAWQSLAAGDRDLSAAALGQEGVTLIAGQPEWLRLDDTAPPALARAVLDGTEADLATLDDLGAIDPPKRAVLEFADAENPLDASAVQVALDGKPIGGAATTLVKVSGAGDARRLTVEVDLEAATADDRGQARRHTLQVVVRDRSVDRRATTALLSYVTKASPDPGAVYLSDLQPVKSFAHAGLILDRSYLGDVAQAAGRVYAKCVMICPEPSAEGAHGEVVYQLPPGGKSWVLRSDIVIESTARTYGSVVFAVQRADAPEGPWETLYTSPVLRGGDEPVPLSVELGAAGYLRLYTTDAGDGINSDHALWGSARLK